MEQDKLNHLLATLPDGVVVESVWLGEHGYSPQLLAKYVASGWLRRVGHGAYMRPGAPLTWEGAVMGLQRYGHQDIHVGGATVFELQGRSQFIRRTQERVIDLYGSNNLPKWVHDSVPGVDFRLVRKTLFNEPDGRGYLVASDVPALRAPIWVSCLERAYLELLDELPDTLTFDSAEYLMQGLPTLSPTKVKALLGRCKSIKVKRLFFFFADRHDHAWRSHLDPGDYDLGSGKRQIVKGGALDRTYQITVPEPYRAN